MGWGGLLTVEVREGVADRPEGGRRDRVLLSS